MEFSEKRSATLRDMKGKNMNLVQWVVYKMSDYVAGVRRETDMHHVNYQAGNGQGKRRCLLLFV